MRIYRKKEFISTEEASILNSWVDESILSNRLTPGIDNNNFNYKLRYTSRLHPERYEYPSLAIDIRDRIIKHLGIKNIGLITGHGRDGIVVSCTFSGGTVYKHKDPIVMYGGHALRCNIMTRAPEGGGKLYINDILCDIEPLELHCYLASKHPHEVTTVEGSTSRVLWMFGGCIDDKDWE
jgi:hypothetical protein